MSLQTIKLVLRLGNLLVILVFILGICIIRAEHDYSVSCASKDTCHECLQTPDCTWCEQPDFSGNHCLPDYLLDKCAENYRVFHNVTEVKIEDKELTRRPGEINVPNESEKIVKIRPQRLNLKIPINQAHRVEFQYSEVEDFPIDVYLLMDLSKSTEADIENHINLADKLSQAVPKMSSNFRLGFGTFAKQKHDLSCDQCEASFGFQNHLSLSMNSSTFKAEVQNAVVSGTLNGHEGGFNALMQTLACRQPIGWRENARRLLIFSSDAGFHYAADNKLRGLITPNDGECHLDRNGFYTKSTQQDYPTISQINQKVKENYINIIFAVNHNQYSAYQKLWQHIEGSSAAILSNDSSNVVELVEAEYGKISSSVEMKDNATSHVKITYYSACLNDGAEKQTSKCDGLKVGDVVSFTAEILVTSCPSDPRDWRESIQIYPVGIYESLVIDLTMLCSCDCENPNYKTYQVKSSKCNFVGTHMCGKCVCDNYHFGQNCECYSTDAKDATSCRPNNATVECSGRGTCVCGACICDVRSNPEEIIFGINCECDNFSCDRAGGRICSGPDHGTCQCGQCLCKPEWEGPDCSCLKSKDTCKSPNGGEICSGHGECQCGHCKCKSTEEGRYSGKYCEKCPTCLRTVE